MTFHHNSRTYRIIFSHDKSRRWEDHMGHSIILARAQKKNVDYQAVTGPAFVYCLTCNLKLSHLNQQEQARNTRCTIYIDQGCQMGDEMEGVKDWRVWAEGKSRLNVKAGDRFDRKTGRVAALSKALQNTPELTNEFWKAIWKWYWHDRKRPLGDVTPDKAERKATA